MDGTLKTLYATLGRREKAQREAQLAAADESLVGLLPALDALQVVHFFIKHSMHDRNSVYRTRARMCAPEMNAQGRGNSWLRLAMDSPAPCAGSLSSPSSERTHCTSRLGGAVSCPFGMYRRLSAAAAVRAEPHSRFLPASGRPSLPSASPGSPPCSFQSGKFDLLRLRHWPSGCVFITFLLLKMVARGSAWSEVIEVHFGGAD